MGIVVNQSLLARVYSVLSPTEPRHCRDVRHMANGGSDCSIRAALNLLLQDGSAQFVLRQDKSRMWFRSSACSDEVIADHAVAQAEVSDEVIHGPREVEPGIQASHDFLALLREHHPEREVSDYSAPGTDMPQTISAPAVVATGGGWFI